MNKKIFGNFQSIEQQKNTEYLQLVFSPSSLSLKQRWQHNGLSADFLGDYLTIFFPKSTKENETYSKQDEIKSTVSYIANELLENAMKFYDKNSETTITIRLNLDVDKLTFLLTNSITKNQAEILENFIKELLNNDPQELYFQKLEENAEINLSDHSGLGIITMINNYNAQVAWKFDTIDNMSTNLIVTTMVELNI